MQNISLEKREALHDYLFKRLSPKDEEIIELRLLQDEDFFKELLLVEDDLLEEYLFEENISQSRKKDLYNFFIKSPELMERLQLTKSLARIAGEELKFIPEENYKQLSVLARIRKIFGSLRHIRYEVVNY